MHCDYPQKGFLTIPGRDLSVIIAFGVWDRGIENGKWPDP